jgi:hypothetical protein
MNEQNKPPVDNTEDNNTIDEQADLPRPEADERPADSTGDDGMDDRLERLGGEPAPVITPEEFARLQKAGQVHIDSRGRVRTTRRNDAEAGVSLRKRRAWYDPQ